MDVSIIIPTKNGGELFEQVLKKIFVRGEICLIEGRVNYRDKLSLIINQAKNVR